MTEREQFEKTYRLINGDTSMDIDFELRRRPIRRDSYVDNTVAASWALWRMARELSKEGQIL